MLHYAPNDVILGDWLKSFYVSNHVAEFIPPILWLLFVTNHVSTISFFNQLCRTRQLHLCECKINIIVQTTPISKHYSVDFIDERLEPRMSMMYITRGHE